MRVDTVPDEHGRTAELLVSGAQQARVVDLGEPFGFVLAPTVDPHPADQPNPMPRLKQISPATWIRPEPLPETVTVEMH
ncbi:hypothetical protein ACGFJC_54145 [Nonomuraea fuscirosea]|uniref:hypothetical protein n=1 Tax=Nonomuraea fuscirosea TaxID=1291556 RepID=UPI00371421B3